MPADVICERLKKNDDHICTVKYEKPKEPRDWANIDLNKMRVKELKEILSEWNEKCMDCSEKGQYIQMIQELQPRYEPSKPATAATAAPATPTQAKTDL